MDKYIWIKDDNSNIYYCEIVLISEIPDTDVVNYTLKSIVGDATAFRILINRDLNIPVTCVIYLSNCKWIFGKACYDFDKLIDNEECGMMEI